MISGQTTCCGAVPMTPASCCTVSSGQWCHSYWARSLCCWRCVRAPWPFELKLSRRGNAPTKCAKTCPPRPQIAAATRPKTPSRRTLTPNCRRQQGPCRCLQCQCDAAIENIKQKDHEIQSRRMLTRWWAKSTNWPRTPPTAPCCLVRFVTS